jgi:hypothetical protein
MNRFSQAVFVGCFVGMFVCVMAMGLLSRIGVEVSGAWEFASWFIVFTIHFWACLGILPFLLIVSDPRPFLLLVREWWSQLMQDERWARTSPRWRVVAICWAGVVCGFILLCCSGSIIQSEYPLGELLKPVFAFLQLLGMVTFFAIIGQPRPFLSYLRDEWFALWQRQDDPLQPDVQDEMEPADE